jgi:metal-responsive CopG/Arc/MetJ family transcriptional regulator
MQSTENAAVQVRLSGAELVALENWRRAQRKIPPRSEAIREAIRQLVGPADDTSDVPVSHGKHRHSP